jgi:hypothetical protein
VVSWNIELYKYHNMYRVLAWRERKHKCIAQECVEMKEARDSDTTMNMALSTESKGTCGLYNMLAIGKFSLLLSIQSKCSGGRPF